MLRKKNFTAILFFFLFQHISSAQPVWREVKSDIVNCFSSHTIYSLKKDGLNNIYASINQSVYRWNGFGWIQLGSTIPSSNSNGTTLTISTDLAGNVYAGGFFKDPGGAYYVAKWNGLNWSRLGSGSSALNANNPILTTAVDAAGDIYAAGQFFNSSGKRYVAKWNGSNWIELGTGANELGAGGEINSIATDGAGNVYAAGQFTNASNKNYVAKWNGTSWTELGGLNGLNAGARIITILVISPTEIYAGGQFTNASGKRYVAKWDGTSWTELGGINTLNANSFIRSIAKDASGIVYCAGDFTDITGKTYISRWNGINWAKAGTESFSSATTSPGIYSIELDVAGKIYVAGDFSNALPSRHVVNLNGNNWELTGLPGTGLLTPPPFSAANIKSLITDHKNNLYAGGGINGGGTSFYVAKWNDTIWQPLGQGVNALNANGGINTMVRDWAGNIYAAGGFTNASGKTYVAKWNGASWSEVGGLNGLNANQSIHSIAVDFSGNVYATGGFTNGAGKHFIAQWNGSVWADIAVPNVPIMSNKTYLTTDSSGFLIAGIHDEHNLYSFIARWNGTTWSDLGVRNGGGSTGVGYETDVLSIAVDKLNNIYTVAGFLGACKVRKWNGSAWSSLGPSDFFTSAFGLYADTSGKIYASGTHLNTIGGYRDDVFIWSGSEWSKISATHSLSSLFYRTALTIDNLGRIYSAGDSTTPFASSYGLVSVYDTLFPETPIIKNVTDKCQSATTAKGKLNNPPRSPGTVKIMLDGSPIAYNSLDSSFTYFINSSTPVGSHRVFVQYLYYIHTLQKDSSFTVFASGPPSVSISTPAATICSGQNITFTATPTNGGSSPSYQWKVNGINTGTNSPVFSSSTLSNGNLVSVVLTSNSICASPTTANSNVIIMIVNNSVSPAIIIAGNTIVTTGQSSSLTALPNNGGAAPSYQWQDSTASHTWQNISGATTSTLNYTPFQTGDKVRSRLTSNANCASPITVTSNILTFTVNTVTAINPVPGSNYGIRYYPSPVNTVLFIDSLKLSDKWQTLEIKSIDGKSIIPIINIANRTTTFVNVERLPAGQYIAVLRRKNGIPAYLKFIKQ
jgi:hypothetical protein